MADSTAFSAVAEVPEIPTALAACLSMVEVPEVSAELLTSPMVSMGLSPTILGVLEGVAV